MVDRPIIFSAPMVRALLASRKTQTRRILKPQPGTGANGCYHRPDGLWIWTHLHRPGNGVGDGVGISDPFAIRFKVGDRLWVRENFATSDAYGDPAILGVEYAADGSTLAYANGELHHKEHGCAEYRGPWKPSIHMPRWASRMTLIVEGVKIERLQEISEEDALAEGCPAQTPEELAGMDARGWYRDLWDCLHGTGAWDANPWVVALTFAVYRSNIDAIKADGLAQPLLVR